MTDLSSRLTPLFDGRPGLRCAMSVQVRNPASSIEHPVSSAEHPPILDFISSDPTLDRYHEIISPAGWQLATYQKNPVFQNAHQYGDIIFTLGRALITEVRQGDPSIPQSALRNPHLYQRIQFAVDANPMAKIAYALYKDHFLNAVSVGFVPLRWQDADGTDHQVERSFPAGPLSSAGGEGGGEEAVVFRTPHSALRAPNFRRKYLEQELLEVSAVAIPANPNALALAYKSGALEKCDLKETAALLTDLASSHRSAPGGSPPGPSSILHPPSSLPSLLDLTREIRSLLAHI